MVIGMADETNHDCDFCEKGYKSKSGLDRHIKKKHPETLIKKTDNAETTTEGALGNDPAVTVNRIVPPKAKKKGIGPEFLLKGNIKNG